MSVLRVYCDGSCYKDGVGGWGVAIRDGGEWIDLYGGAKDTTNNRMELTAAIKALDYLNRDPQVSYDVKIYCDSQYVTKGITEYVEDWVFRNWRTSANKPVKNQDLWLELTAAASRHNIEWKWVRGHVGIPGNERADMLADKGVELARRPPRMMRAAQPN